MFLIVIDHFLEIVVLLSFLLYLLYDKFTSIYINVSFFPIYSLE